MATTTTSKSILVDENTRKLRSVVSKRLRMKEDPEKLRWILTQYGYTDESVNSEIERQMSFQTGKPMPVQKEAFNASDLGTGDLRKQYEALSMAKDEVSKYRSIIDKYTSDNAPVQLTGKEAAELRTAQSSLLFLIAQASGTGALQAPDREVVERIIPDPTSISGATGILTRGGKQGMLTSLDKAQDILNSRLSLLSGGQSAATPSASNNVATPTAQANPIDQQAVKWLEANPNDPRAEKVRAKLQSKGFLGSSTAPASSAVSGSTEPNSAFGGDLAGAVGRTTGKIFGGDKIGEAIGNVLGGQLAKNGEAGQLMQDNLAKLTQLKADGKIDEEKYNMLVDNLEKTAKEAFGYTGPSFKEVAGDAIKVGATFLGGGAVRGATLLGTAARTAAVGATYSAGNAMAEDKDLRGVVIDSLIGGAVAGSIPVVGKVIGKGFKAIVGKNTPEEALGEIIQGKTKDLKPGQRALAAIDASDVKTYEDLASKLDDNVSFLSGKVDELLGKDKTLTPLAQLATETKSKSGKVVTSNYVQKAIQDLEELYAKTGDNVKAQNMRELLAQAETNGLSKLDVNQIAREYGKAYKSFTKFGEQLTSVNSKMYENTRSGLKEVARRGLDGEAAKNLDGLISDTMHTRELIEKNMEAVNRLEQRAEKMGLGRILVTKAIRAIDISTLGATRAIRETLIQSNVGKKTMNALDIESKLQDNLKIIEKAIKANTPGKFEKALQELNKKLLNTVKGKGGLSLQDVSKDVTKKVQYKTLDGWKTLDEIAQNEMNLRTGGNATAKIVGEEGIRMEEALAIARKKVKGLKGRIMSKSGDGKFSKQ